MQQARITLNEAQHDAVYSREPLLCCACPGSGKTRVLVERAEHLLSSPKNERLLMVTFTRDAAREMHERIKRRVGAQAVERVTIGTFHSLALRQLGQLEKPGRILGQVETDHLVRSALARARSDIPFDEAEERIAMCKMDHEYASRDKESAHLTEIYRQLQQQRKALDFTDIMVRCVELMESGDLSPWLAEHILADEYQDIDRIQARWLYQHIRPGVIPCAVGDDDQSVYGFRRALGYEGMMEFASKTGARTITLGVNYRSTEEILNHSSRLIACNLDRVAKNMTSARGKGQQPLIHYVEPPEEPAGKIIELLDLACGQNPRQAVPEGIIPYRFAVRPGQAAVLARTNQHLAAIEVAFIERRIPYLRTGRGFWTHAAIQTLSSLLSSLDKGDEVGLEVALRWAGAGDALLDDLGRMGGESVVGLLKSEEHRELPGGPVVAEFIKCARGWRRKLADSHKRKENVEAVIYGSVGWMISVLCGTCGVSHDDVIAPPAPPIQRQVTRLEAARDLLLAFRGSLRQRLNAVKQDDNQEMPRVILSTFHASKGLEWDHVFLIDVVDGVVPSPDKPSVNGTSMVGEQALAEERRVFYVAMTRARDALHIFTSKTRGISEFLYDAGLVGGARK